MVSDEKLLYFCRNLAASIKSGLPPEQIVKDKTLHESLSVEGDFPPVFISMVKAGEEGGKIDEFLDKFAECLEIRIDFKRRLMRALAYPLFTVILLIVLFFLFVLKALPFMLEPLESAGVRPSESVAQLIQFGRVTEEHWQIILMLFTATLALAAVLYRSRQGRRTAAAVSHWIPGLRFISEHAHQDIFLTTSGLLLESGLPPTQILGVLGQLFEDDPVTRRRLKHAELEIARGNNLSSSLKSMLNENDLRALEIAEKAGRIADSCRALGKLHRDAQRHRLKIVAIFLQIAATIIIAGFVGGLIWLAIQSGFGAWADTSAIFKQ